MTCKSLENTSYCHIVIKDCNITKFDNTFGTKLPYKCQSTALYFRPNKQAHFNDETVLKLFV